MRKEYKVLICILALIFSIGATCIGFGLIGSSSLKFGMTFGSLVYEEEKYSIGIPTVLYKELLLIAEGKEENLLEKLLEKISSKETYLLDIVPDEALLWMV